MRHRSLSYALAGQSFAFGFNENLSKHTSNLYE